MKKLRRNLSIILPAITILGMLAVTGHAKKPTAPPEPTVKVTGGIKILPDGTTSDPSKVRVQFVDPSFDPFVWLAGNSFPANADRSPALYTVIMRAGPPDTLDRWLRFYFCAHPSHQQGTGKDVLKLTGEYERDGEIIPLEFEDSATFVFKGPM